MFTLMVTQTNMNIEDKIRKLQQNKEHIFESSKYTYLKTTDAFEMRAFIGFIPPGMRRRSDVSFRSHLGWNVADHIETSSRRCY